MTIDNTATNMHPALHSQYLSLTLSPLSPTHHLHQQSPMSLAVTSSHQHQYPLLPALFPSITLISSKVIPSQSTPLSPTHHHHHPNLHQHFHLHNPHHLQSYPHHCHTQALMPPHPTPVTLTFTCFCCSCNPLPWMWDVGWWVAAHPVSWVMNDCPLAGPGF